MAVEHKTSEQVTDSVSEEMLEKLLTNFKRRAVGRRAEPLFNFDWEQAVEALEELKRHRQSEHDMYWGEGDD